MKKSLTHAELNLRAVKWLLSQGCSVAVSEIKCYNNTGEIIDALGFHSQLSTLIECKTSRSDFLADKKKNFRKDPARGVGQHRYFLCEKDIIKPSDLPRKWGLLWVTGRGIKKVVYPTGWESEQRFKHEYNHASERSILISAVRRLGVFQDGIEGKVFFKEKKGEIQSNIDIEVKNALEKAAKIVEPVTKAEREGEHYSGDLLSFHMK